MRISSSTFNNDFLGEIQQLEQKQNTLQGEASSGLSVTNPEDNPSVMSQVLDLQTETDANNQFQTNINSLQSTASIASTALNSLQSLVSQASEIATEAANGTTSSTQLSTYASQVESLIQEAVQLGNTQDANGNYIFAGTASNTQPFSATTNANGSVTAVTYNGNDEESQSQIAANITISAAVPGVNNSGSGPEGVFSDSRTGADLFSHLISLQQNLASGNISAISSTDAPALAKDEDNMVNQISANGVTQSALTAAGSIATSQNTTLAEQISGNTDADLAQTMTQLDQTQTAYEAALESGTMVMNMSLLNFIA